MPGNETIGESAGPAIQVAPNAEDIVPEIGQRRIAEFFEEKRRCGMNGGNIHRCRDGICRKPFFYRTVNNFSDDF